MLAPYSAEHEESLPVQEYLVGGIIGPNGETSEAQGSVTSLSD